jgi:phage terminase small subunit
MIKKCPSCKKNKEMRSNQKYCCAKCKKNFENSQRSVSGNKVKNGVKTIPKTPSNPPLAAKVIRPSHLNEIAADYWDKIAPTVESRGHLNVLSEDAFAEMCNIYSQLVGINKAIDETNRSLLQLEEKWDNKNKVQIQSNKESALSDIKRKYSKLFLDYQKQFYLIPLSNRGNFGLDDKETVDPHDEFLNMGGK